MSSLCINVGVYVVLVRACRGRGVCRLGAYSIYMWGEGCMSSWRVHVGEGCMSSWCVHVGEGCMTSWCIYMWNEGYMLSLCIYVGCMTSWCVRVGEGVYRLGAYRGVHVVLVRTCGGGVYVVL